MAQWVVASYPSQELIFMMCNCKEEPAIRVPAGTQLQDLTALSDEDRLVLIHSIRKLLPDPANPSVETRAIMAYKRIFGYEAYSTIYRKLVFSCME